MMVLEPMQRVLGALAPGLATLSWAARRALAKAVDAALLGDRSLALAELCEALGHDPEVPAARLIAAQIRYSLRQYQGALDELDVAARLGAEPHADELRYGFTVRVGWNHEAREVVLRRIAAGGGRRWRGRAVQLFDQLHHHAGALEQLKALMASSPPSASLELNAAHLAARVGAHDEARQHALAAVALEPERAALRTAAALLLGEGGFCAEALEQARRAIELSNVGPAYAAFAELSLWVGDLESAEAHAARCLGSGGERIRGGVRVLRGDYAEGLAELERALERDPADAEAHVWRGEALLGLRRFDEATEATDRALGHAEGYPLAAQVIRLLARLEDEGDRPDRLRAPSFDELRESVFEIAAEAPAIFASGERSGARRVLREVLLRLGGNRSDRPTWLAEGQLRPLCARGARFSSRAALELIRLLPLDQVLTALDDVAARHPESSLPIAYRGEANLWMGCHQEARRDLEIALSINPHTRWAYIGLTALELAAGRFEQALEVSALGVARIGSTGPAVYVYRGEAYRRLGQLDRALEDLELACRLNEWCLGAVINLALTCRQANQHERAQELYRELVRRAAGLLSDAALSAGVEAFDSANPEQQQQLLERALGLMRGNRSSSCPTYVSDRGRVRTAPAGLCIGPELDERDRSALIGAAQWLEQRRSPSETIGEDKRCEPYRDVELVALRAGLRSAVRLAVVPAEVETTRARYAAAGEATLVSSFPAEYDAETHLIVFLARSEADARRALAAEESNDNHELGRLLGYPACCIEAFSRRRHDFTVFEGARSAWVARPVRRLNNLCFGSGARFISFEPCRYDCPRASAAADAIALALARVSPESVAWCDAELSHAVAIDEHDARARVELERGKIVAAQPLPSIPGRPIAETARALARCLLGAEVGVGGRVRAEGLAETFVFDFAWQSRGS